MRLLICVFILLIYSCSKVEEIGPDKNLILAKVADKYITIQDFIQRSEYTIRPDYCKKSNYIHKKIILNSLIAEKMIALEMENRFEDTYKSKFFDYFIKGRKEQAMRQLLYNNDFFDQALINDETVKKHYNYAGRTVNVQYINLPSLEIVEKVNYLLEDGISLDSIYSSIWSQRIPEKSIRWVDRESDLIIESIFNENIKSGKIIGPLKTEENSYLIMKIINWVDQPAITEEQRKIRYNDTVEKLKETKAKKTHSKWVESLMSKKKIEFNKEIFKQYAKIAGNHYLKKESDKETAINKAIWAQAENSDLPTLANSKQEKQLNLNEELFTYDGYSWSIEDFNKALLSHPLVFRKKKMSRSDFPNQLRLAIADLIRNLEINKKCYEKELNNHWIVQSNISMWSDAYLAKKYKEIRNLKRSNDDQLINSTIDSLQLIFSDQITINTNAFENIELTSTDMMVTQSGVPYPIIVPSFPKLTNDDKLDYGKKMELLNEN